MMILRMSAFAATLALAGTIAAAASPTPIPGGANQVNAISGKVGDTLWNGVIRLKVVEVRDATPADHPESLVPLANQKVMVITAILRNGTNATWQELVSYTLADKDGITYDVPGHFFTPVSLSIQQAAAAKQTGMFTVDKTFAPVKLIVKCDTCAKNSFKAFRVTIPPPTK